MSAELEAAIARLRAGDKLGGETIVAEAAKDAAREHGPTSPEYVAALADLAMILGGVGDLQRAAQVLEQACAIAPVDAESERNRLTHNMNLGDVLLRMNRLADAERVLRDGLTGRERFYGREHPGYAYGIEPLAGVLLAQGRGAEALPLAEEAVGILQRASHPRVSALIALRALATASAKGSAAGSFAEVPEAIFDEVLRASLTLADLHRPDIGLELLRGLRAELAVRRGEDDPWMIDVTSAISNVARHGGDHSARIVALEWLVERLHARDPRQGVDALLGLALAQGDAHAPEAAEKTYREAIEQARALGMPAQVSQVLRNFGLYLAELGRREEAGPMLSEATAAARAAGGEIVGRALIAEGIFRQHDGRLEEAAPLLEQGLRSLPPSHPDTLAARSHLNAIHNDASCGCGDMSGALGEALRAMVLPQLPAGLLDHIDLEMGEKGPKLDVRLAREPTEKEMELLDRVVRQAVAELQERIRKA